jgi:two-component system chemotaxis response regulator CheY
MKILIVEDDFVSRSLLRRILSPLGECQVATNGEEGLEAFSHAMKEGAPFELICLDIMLPQLSGLELLQCIRDQESEAGVGGLSGARIIMTTAIDDRSDVVGAFKLGCEAYMVKPIDRSELLKKIAELGIKAPE